MNLIEDFLFLRNHDVDHMSGVHFHIADDVVIKGIGNGHRESISLQLDRNQAVDARHGFRDDGGDALVHRHPIQVQIGNVQLMREGIDKLALGDMPIFNEDFTQTFGGALLFGQSLFQRLLRENAGIHQDLTQFHGCIFHCILPRRSKKSNLRKQGQIKVCKRVKLR